MCEGPADGHQLPPMVMYQTENVFIERWCVGLINCDVFLHKKGMFDAKQFEKFEMWFFRIFVLAASDLAGPTVLIGDNLGSQFMKKGLQYCDKNNIEFLCFPPNSTYLCQAVDVDAAVLTIKFEWCDILDT